MVQLEWEKNENTFFLSLTDLHSPNLGKFYLSLQFGSLGRSGSGYWKPDRERWAVKGQTETFRGTTMRLLEKRNSSRELG